MSNRRIVVYAALVVAVIVGAASFFAEEEQQGASVPSTPPGALQIEKSTVEVKAQRSPTVSLPPPAARDQMPDWRGLLGPSRREFIPSYREEPLLALRHLQELNAAAAGGDGPAALSLYQLAEYCGVAVWQRDNPGRTMRTECDSVSASLGRDSYGWLSAIAATGNTEVATFLLSEALQARRHRNDPEMARIMSDGAVEALQKAGTSGDLHAIKLLAGVYANGLLGEWDNVKAFAYLDVYAQATGEKAALNQAMTLKKNLRKADFDAVGAIQLDFLRRIQAKCAAPKECPKP